MPSRFRKALFARNLMLAKKNLGRDYLALLRHHLGVRKGSISLLSRFLRSKCCDPCLWFQLLTNGIISFTAITRLITCHFRSVSKQKEPTSQSLFWQYFTYIIGRIFLSNLLKIKVVEAAGVEPLQVLKTRKLLILRTDKKYKTDRSPITACKLHTKSAML